ncbi:MAG: thermonuclease family protein [Rubrivivax sp.]
MKSIAAVVTTSAALLATASAAAPPLQGTVSEVYDGETVLVNPPSGAAFQVKLNGIDAPEICQTWGTEAKAALKEWVQDRQVSILPAGRADKASLSGTLMLEGANINRRMVEEGHAWSVRTRWDQGPFMKQERMAKALNRGLFGQCGAQMPADFRRTHKPCA